MARRWAELDPLENEAHYLIPLLAAIGRRAEALREYEEQCERIAQELEVEPLEQTRELIARIRRKRDGRRVPAARPPGGPKRRPAWPAAAPSRVHILPAAPSITRSRSPAGHGRR